MALSLDDLREDWSDEALTPVDRIAPPQLTEAQRAWREEGLVILPEFMPHSLIHEYAVEWCRAHSQRSESRNVWERHRNPKGWEDCTPYMRHASLRALCCYRPLALKLQEIIGEPMGVHLNLTGWVSTQRDWHSDQYLNEPHVGGFYAAVWVALADISEDAGPFQWIPRSHLWPPLSQERVLAALEPDERGPRWPTYSERVLTPLFERKFAAEGVAPRSFVAKKGDVLIWSGRLVHRGSRPDDLTLERRALISHYSGISHRPDMPKPVRFPGGGWFFPILESGPVF